MTSRKRKIWRTDSLIPISLVLLATLESHAIYASSSVLLPFRSILFPSSTLHSSSTLNGTQSKLRQNFDPPLFIRGGISSDASDEEYKEYDSVGEGEADDEDGVQSSVNSKSSSIGGTLIHVLFSTSKAIARSFKAALSISSSDQSKDLSLVERIFHRLGRMWAAAFAPARKDRENGNLATETKDKKLKTPKRSESADFGDYLAEAYGVDDGRDRSESASPSPILGGSLNQALQIARSNARLLAVMIPSAGLKSRSKADMKAVESFLSAEVSTVAKKKARKSGETASFLLWGAKAGSSEAILAMKRLKIKVTDKKGEKRPILLVAYPAQVSATCHISLLKN